MKIALFLLLFCCQLIPSIAQDGNPSKESFTNKADALLVKAVQAGECIGIAAGFSIEGATKWQGGAGHKDLEHRLDFDTQTLTRIASITKPMTAIAIMQLYEQGKIELDKPIQEYLPDFPVKKEGAITIRHLLTHSSGIDDYKSDKEQENKKNYPTLADAVKVFKDRELIAEPGTAFHYSTYGYVVLGLLLEKVSGMRYEAYLKKNIWDKSGMSHTGIEYSDTSYSNKSLLYHRNSKGKIKEADPTNLSDRIPGGGVYSCVADMLQFGDAVLNYSLIKESTLKMMLENPDLKTQGNGYGFGWYLYGENPKYGNVFGHNGTQTGASTFLMLLPEQKTTIVVLSNTSGAMQAVSNITIQLFDVAAEANNSGQKD